MCLLTYTITYYCVMHHYITFIICNSSKWKIGTLCITFNVNLYTGFCKMVVANVVWLMTHATHLWTLNPLSALSTCTISGLSGLKTCSCGSNSIQSSIWDIKSSYPCNIFCDMRVQSKVKVQRWPMSQMTFATTILQTPVFVVFRHWLICTKHHNSVYIRTYEYDAAQLRSNSSQTAYPWHLGYVSQSSSAMLIPCTMLYSILRNVLDDCCVQWLIILYGERNHSMGSPMDETPPQSKDR